MAGMHVVVIQVKVLVVLLCLPSNNTLEKQGTAALSSLAHLPTYKIHDHAVYFHINKVHPFKLGCEFNLEAGLSAKPPSSSAPLFVKKHTKYTHCNHCLLIIFAIFNSCLAHFSMWVLMPKNVETLTV